MAEIRSLLLASASPRRQELLRQIGVNFEIVRHGIDESRLAEESPPDYALRMAAEKALDVLSRVPADRNPAVLGADTIVVCAGEILGKPCKQQDAQRILSLLSDRVHTVYSAVAVCDRHRKETTLVESSVEFRALSAEEITAYWETGEPADKAGAYAIQGLGAVFVKHLQGSHSAVMGLPLYETASLLRKFAIPCWVPETAQSGGQQQ
jgi:septum formation protein